MQFSLFSGVSLESPQMADRLRFFFSLSFLSRWNVHVCLCYWERETKRGSWCHSECGEGFFDFQEGSMTVWQGLRGHGRKSFDADCRQKASTTYKWLFILSFFSPPSCSPLLVKCLGSAGVGRYVKKFQPAPVNRTTSDCRYNCTEVYMCVCPPTDPWWCLVLCSLAFGVSMGLLTHWK